MRFVERDKWLWQCDCGKTKVIRASLVKSGKVQSCGCVLSQTALDKVTTQNVLQNYDGTQVTQLRAAVDGRAKLRTSNTTGYIGVSERVYPNGRTRYQARLMLRGKEISLGIYDTPEQAAEARKKGEEQYFKPVIDDYDSQTQS